MEEELGAENMLTEEEANNLFADDSSDEQDDEPIDGTPIDEDSLFENDDEEEYDESDENDESVEDDSDEENPESVDSDEEYDEDEEDTKSRKRGAPKNNLYSSIASALREDGVLSTLEDDDYDNVETPDDFRNLIEKEVNSQLSAVQKRIDDALNDNVPVNDIKKYENTLAYLNSITKDMLEDEGSKGDKLRQNLIYQDCINRGYSDAKAKKEVKKSFDAGSDIDDARDALQSNYDFYKNSYDQLRNHYKQEQEQQRKMAEEFSLNLNEAIMRGDYGYSDMEVDAKTRRRIHEIVTTPVAQDEYGNTYTELQKYQYEHPIEFTRNVGYLYNLTKGFTDMSGLFEGKIKKGVKKGIRNLENVLNNTSRDFDGNIKFVSNDDSESAYKGWSLDS